MSFIFKEDTFFDKLKLIFYQESWWVFLFILFIFSMCIRDLWWLFLIFIWAFAFMLQKIFLLFRFVSIKYSITLILNSNFTLFVIFRRLELSFSFLFLMHTDSINFYPRSIYKIQDFLYCLFIIVYFNSHSIRSNYFHEEA